MIVLGVDPGLRAMGYGVIEVKDGTHRALDWGTIETTPKTAIPGRLRLLYDGLTQILELRKPDTTAFEALIFAQNVQSALALGQARGVAILAVAERNLDMVEYSPKEIKRTIAGQGNASKEQVLRMIKVLLGLKEEKVEGDAADALAVAMTHALICNRKRLLKMGR